MAFWDALKTEQGYPWNPTPGAGQRNDYSIPLVQGTRIEAPVSGIVLPEHTSGSGDYSYYGRKPWGGEVDVLTFLPKYGGLVNVNMLHFDTINVQPGDVVVKGQTVLGTSGGQTSGGTMPSSPQYSTGPHIGIGVHAPDSWDRMYNPQSLISDLLAGQDSSAVPSQTQIQGSGLGWLPRGSVVQGNQLAYFPQQGNNSQQQQQAADQFKKAPQNCDAPIIGGIWCQIQTWLGALWNGPQAFGIRAIKMLLGVGLFSTGIVLFVAGSLGGDIAAAAVTAAGMPEAAPFASAAVRGRGGPVRSIGNAIRTRGAIAGQKTLTERQEKGRTEGKAEFARILVEQRREAYEKGQRTKAANIAREQQEGTPVYEELGLTQRGKPIRGKLIGHMRGGQFFDLEGTAQQATINAEPAKPGEQFQRATLEKPADMPQNIWDRMMEVFETNEPGLGKAPPKEGSLQWGDVQQQVIDLAKGTPKQEEGK